MNAVQQVIHRLERALAQLGREMDGLPDGDFMVEIREGQARITDITAGIDSSVVRSGSKTADLTRLAPPDQSLGVDSLPPSNIKHKRG